MTAKVWGLSRPWLGDRGHRALGVPCADPPHSPLCHGDALGGMGEMGWGENPARTQHCVVPLMGPTTQRSLGKPPAAGFQRSPYLQGLENSYRGGWETKSMGILMPLLPRRVT